MTLDPRTPLRDQVDLDSIDWLNFFSALQDGLQVQIPSRDYRRLDTLEALLAYLADKRVRGARPVTRRALARMHRLADERTVAIRPLKPEDAEHVRDFIEGTTPESRYRRFHKYVSAPSAPLVHFMTDIDPARAQAFVCTSPTAAGEEVVGEARCVASGEAGVCELGILVRDDWQHSGIAGLLIEAVIRAARARGYKAMHGLVLAHNTPMLAFAHALGFDVEHLADDPHTVRIVLGLDDVPTRRRVEPQGTTAPR